MLDVLRERCPPFSPDAVVAEYAALLLDYGLSRVMGDRYAAEWTREGFRTHGISYRPAELSKSDLHGNPLPRLNSRRVVLLDNPKCVEQDRRAGAAGLSHDRAELVHLHEVATNSRTSPRA